MFDGVKRIFWLWGQCFKSMGRVSTFVPFVLYALVQLGVLISLINFINPPFANIYIPIIKKFFNAAALHYPTFYVFVAPLFNQINLVLSGIIGIVLIAMATKLFAQKFRDEAGAFGEATGTSFKKYGSLFVVWLIETVLTLVIIIGLPTLLKKIFDPDYRMMQIFEFAGLLLGILVASLFAYTTALIVLDNQSIGESLSKTLKIFSRYSFTSYVIVAVPTLAYFPLSFILRKVDFLITKFSPEMITTLLGFGILLTFFTSYLQIGSITRFYLLVTERKR
ncbi:hypothetical protein JW960_08065 [candidate division KSB1 bacterium]|nr:hypothetical protein [candidate division KSB1 bacterium]